MDSSNATNGTHSLSGAIFTGEGWIQGELHWQHGVLTPVTGQPIAEHDARPPYLVPGFIDLHVHGGGGRDVMEGGSAMATIAASHAQHGTTSLLATTMTASHQDIVTALESVAAYCEQQANDIVAADVIGAHLEGPYINAGKLGAQPDATRVATVEELELYHRLLPLKVITLAPECLEQNGALEWLLSQQIRVQAGHTLATYEQAQQAWEAGVRGFTHLFNAMPPLNHRAPGLLGFALANAEYAEIIPDLVHVHAGALNTALRAIPSLYAITDGTAACAMPDGEYRLGTQPVFKQGGCVRLHDGNLAGSCLTLDQALRNLVTLGRSLGDACQRVSTIPARYLGLNDRGQLAEGYRADIAVLDQRLQLTKVVCAGREVPR
ncbi:N-acetylglucosamine-6-phosphate deacetylase [Carnimonas nigrificans]|uniref:N-acetylglucosamine-6-phosphate deacetylase n=1 Tax=Carnimonas nigrificans TaxID=64323 RepID=UPI0006860CCA|nr:N-acetylglucosamine-6-phosphate deacetylase [Carnimonas nigrificans]